MSKTLPLLLLVDDAPELALLVRHLGERAGYALDYCEDGEAAWAYLTGAGRRPDLVVLDFHLPGRDGASWCRQLRATTWGVGLPVALFSHGSQSAALAEGLDAGIDYFLAKDLLSEPDAWQVRLGEILTGVGRPLPPDLGAAPAASPAAWQRALRIPVVRQLGPEVLAGLLRRAAQRVGVAAVPDLAEIPLEQFLALAGAFEEELWRVLGTAAGGAFRAALAAR